MSEERWLRWLPFGLLGMASAVAAIASPALGDAAADVPPTLAVAAVTAVWMLVTPSPGPLNYAGRTALAFVLCWLNPLFAIFGFFGFIDAWEALSRRWVHVGVGVVAITQAGAQSGGLPPESAGQALLFVVLVVVNGGLASGFMKMGLRTEERNAALERLNADLEQALVANDVLQQQLIAQARATGVQEERARLAREIHDTIAQSLAGIVTQLEASVGGERQERALALAREALAEARRSMLDLSPADLDGATLPEALDGVVAAWSADQSVRADVVVTGEPVPLHPEVEATVLRIAQESLANVAKHAGAQRVGVTLSYDGDEVVLDVRDDGAGFDLGAPTRPSSFGLRGMRQRAARLAGDLTLESRPGGGTAVSARLPALAREAA
ncbi:sensor histidine kinase [Nocardioides sp. S-58]|uniref:Sensor histidine kinase n=1 Tax=Nocardioides renjunii TaxID=3095075 RepID=A0ABU5K5V3_9ACTN|nr:MULTISPECIES: sensor histidine kinase [unclassified Nocardioides]MDZ5660256.1 sensor histidine kinase [Nocardioides sp. S-58]WQQ21266.1 sensor histidine kinase [Nocardioides sp. S-34]